MEIDELVRVLSRHSKWLESGGEEGARACLEWAYLVGANMQNADLRRAAASHVFLMGGDLRGADLRWIEMRWAFLKGADMRNTDLSGADLSWCDLRETNLQGALLNNANLEGAEMDGALLDGASLDGANIRWSHGLDVSIFCARHNVQIREM